MSAAVSSPAPTTPAAAPAEWIVPGAFDAFSAKLGHLPAWWHDVKRRAWARYLELPYPRRTDELWRFSDLQGLRAVGPFTPAAPAADAVVADALARSNLVTERAAQIVFVNDALAASAALPADLAKAGVVFTTIEQAVVNHEEQIKRHFMSQEASLGSEKLAALHRALTAGGAFIFVPKGVEIAQPLVVYHWVAGARAAVFPHTLVVAEDNAKVTVVEFRQSVAANEEHFAAGVHDLHAGPGAQITYIAGQNYSPSTLSYHGNDTLVQRDARVLSLGVQLGGRQTRTESHSRMQGTGAHSEMLSLAVAHDAQEFDQRTLQSHQAEHTTSNLLYKNALFNEARTIFSGLIIVDPGAQKTDAYQSNRNLLCSPEAEANSLPGLEIQANDVRCTHGSTTGKIDDEQMFYLAARGVPTSVAQQLLVFGFFEEVLNKLENEHVHEVLRNLIQAKFARR